MKISDLNGDSTVSNVAYINGCVEFQFEDGETGKTYNVSSPTTRFKSEAAFADGTAHLRIIDLKSKLPVEPKSQIYMAPQDFGAQMQAAAQGFLLAVGLKSSDWPLFLQVRGYHLLVACPIQSEESVRVQPVTQ